MGYTIVSGNNTGPFNLKVGAMASCGQTFYVSKFDVEKIYVSDVSRKKYSERDLCLPLPTLS